MKKKHIPISIVLCLFFIVSAGFSDDRGISVRENRLALVVGNANYQNYPLKNPVNDAHDFTSTLKNLGFEVIYRENANQRVFEEAIRDFENRLRQLGGIGLFYYAGHGVQVKDGNFLIPVDAQIYHETDIKYEAIHAGRILDAMYNASNRMNIVILDACRDNPFARSFRSATQGLASMDAPTGTIIAYATSPGNVAADGEGRNSYYTKHLLKHIPDPSLNIEKVFKNVRIGVMKETANRQVPWESSSLTGDFFFNPRRLPTETPVAKPNLPEPPPAADIDKYENIIRERKEIREKWEGWQAKLKASFEKVEKYDHSPELTSQEKFDAWQTFLASYGADNPFSKDDDAFRKTAQEKKAFWQSKATETITAPDKPDRSQKPTEPLTLKSDKIEQVEKGHNTLPKRHESAETPPEKLVTQTDASLKVPVQKPTEPLALIHDKTQPIGTNKENTPRRPEAAKKPPEQVEKHSAPSHKRRDKEIESESKASHNDKKAKRMLILPFHDVRVGGKRNDLDIDALFDLLAKYETIKINGSYYNSDILHTRDLHQFFPPGEIEKLWSAKIDANNQFIAELAKKCEADLVLLYKKIRRRVELSFHETQSNDPAKNFSITNTLHVYVIDLENRKTYEVSKDFSGGLFSDGSTIVASITRSALDQYFDGVSGGNESGTLSSEK